MVGLNPVSLLSPDLYWRRDGSHVTWGTAGAGLVPQATSPHGAPGAGWYRPPSASLHQPAARDPAVGGAHGAHEGGRPEANLWLSRQVARQWMMEGWDLNGLYADMVEFHVNTPLVDPGPDPEGSEDLRASPIIVRFCPDGHRPPQDEAPPGLEDAYFAHCIIFGTQREWDQWEVDDWCDFDGE